MSNVVIILTRLWLGSAKLLICNCICSRKTHSGWQAACAILQPNISSIHSSVFVVLKALCRPIRTASEIYWMPESSWRSS